MPTSAATVMPLVVKLLSPMAAEHEVALLKACSLAHQRGPCLFEEQATPLDTLRATVETEGATHVLLEITDTDPEQSRYASRELAFAAEDDPDERARAIGLALGVLASSLTDGATQVGKSDSETVPTNEAPKPDEDQPTEKGKVEPTDTREQLARPRPPIWSLSAELGGAWDPTWNGGGPSGASHFRLYSKNGFGLGTSLSATYYPGAGGSPQVSSSELLLGPAFMIMLGKNAWSFHAEAGVGGLWAKVPSSATHQGNGSRFSAAARLGSTMAIPLNESLWFIASPSVDFDFSPTELFVDGATSGTTGAATLHLRIGLGWTPARY